MRRLSASIGHNLRRLLDFSGRDGRAHFWPYVLVLFGVAVVATFVLMVPVLFEMMVKFQRVLTDHPDELARHYEQGRPGLPPGLMPDFSRVMLPMALVNLVFMLLIAAAVARRLHDRDRTGLWGLLPLPPMAIGHVAGEQAYAVMSGVAEPSPISALLMLNSLLFWGVAIVLVVFLAGPGDAGPNRYGPPPQPSA